MRSVASGTCGSSPHRARLWKGHEEAARGVSVVPAKGHRHGNRERELMGTFGTVTIAVSRARLDTADGKTTEWQNKTLPAYRRRTKEIEALIAGSYLAGCNTRRVGRALAAHRHT